MFLRNLPIINIIIAAIVTLALCIALGVGLSLIVTSSSSTSWEGSLSPYPFIATFGVISIMLIFIVANHRAISAKSKHYAREIAPPYCLSRDDFADLVNDICEEYAGMRRPYHSCFMLCEIEATIPEGMSELQFSFDIATDDYGTLLRRILRNTDYVGQLSPKVFGILLLETTRMQAEAAAQRILEILGKSEVSENVNSAISNFKINGVMSDQPRLYGEFIDSLTHKCSADRSGLLTLNLSCRSKSGNKTQQTLTQSIS